MTIGPRRFSGLLGLSCFRSRVLRYTHAQQRERETDRSRLIDNRKKFAVPRKEKGGLTPFAGLLDNILVVLLLLQVGSIIFL